MELINYYEELNIDSSLYYSEQALLIAKKNNQDYAQANVLNSKGYELLLSGRFRESLNCLQQGYGLLENPGHEKKIGVMKTGYLISPRITTCLAYL